MGLDLRKGFVEHFARFERLDQSAHRAHAQTALAFFFGGDDLHRNMPGVDIVFQPIEHAPAVDVR